MNTQTTLIVVIAVIVVLSLLWRQSSAMPLAGAFLRGSNACSGGQWTFEVNTDLPKKGRILSGQVLWSVENKMCAVLDSSGHADHVKLYVAEFGMGSAFGIAPDGKTLFIVDPQETAVPSWILTRQPETGKYYMIHAESGRYLAMIISPQDPSRPSFELYSTPHVVPPAPILCAKL